MRKSLFAISAALLLASAGAAFAQSRQGGYLGLNPGAHVSSPNQVSASPTAQDTSSTSRGSRFISPNDPRYQDTGAPRAGEPANENTPYAGIRGLHAF